MTPTFQKINFFTIKTSLAIKWGCTWKIDVYEMAPLGVVRGSISNSSWVKIGVCLIDWFIPFFLEPKYVL